MAGDDDAVLREARASVYGLDFDYETFGVVGGGGVEDMAGNGMRGGRGVSACMGAFMRDLIDDAVHLSDVEVVVEQLRGTGSLSASSAGMLELEFGERPFCLAEGDLVLHLLEPYIKNRTRARSVLGVVVGDGDGIAMDEITEAQAADALASWRCMGSGSGTILARFMHANPSLVFDKSVVEIGSAGGLVSLVMAHAGAAQVLCTSLPGPPMEWSDVNLYLSGPGADRSTRIASIPIDWREEAVVDDLVSSLSSRTAVCAFDVVCGADVVGEGEDRGRGVAKLCSMFFREGTGLGLFIERSTDDGGFAVFRGALAELGLRMEVLDVPVWLKWGVEGEGVEDWVCLCVRRFR